MVRSFWQFSGFPVTSPGTILQADGEPVTASRLDQTLLYRFGEINTTAIVARPISIRISSGRPAETGGFVTQTAIRYPALGSMTTRQSGPIRGRFRN